MGESTLLMVFILLLLKIVAVRILLHDYYNQVLSLLYSVVEHEYVWHMFENSKSKIFYVNCYVTLLKWSNCFEEVE